MADDPDSANVTEQHAQQTIEEILAQLRGAGRIHRNIVRWHKLDAAPAQYASFPDRLSPELIEVLRGEGYGQLYTHQAEATERSLAGEHVVVVTPTASGKTLCYNLPVLQRLYEREEARALYLFPTKALSHDQYRNLHTMTEQLGRELKVYTFDGDTPAAARRSIRTAGQIVLTNPDMLHAGILPNHTRWIKLFENLETIVIDELHQYRGVFGSHVANVIRRLKRICAFYGSSPRFICCSATIANPGAMAEQLIEEPVTVISKNGAPRGERQVIMYNPPVVNHELGIRASAVKEARRLALRFIERGLQTIVFAPSRIRVEILTTYLKRAMRRLGQRDDRIRGYRGGYLPRERREIEEGIKTGQVLGVVSTNALELGIDIGSLQVAVLTGFPGTIASTWQQGGRAGRKGQTAVMVLVANSSPVNQFLMQHPEYLLEASPEEGILNPDNVMILVSHLKCAVNELPMACDETYGGLAQTTLLDYLADENIMRRVGDRYHWASESYPAEEVSLRTAVAQNFIIHDRSNDNRVLGEVDFDSAQMLVHPKAVYIHQGVTFFVEELDWEKRKAYVRCKKADYYTDAISKSDLFVLHVDESDTREHEETDAGTCFQPLLSRNFGEVRVDIKVPKFKKIKFETHESIGYGEIDLPQYELHTQAAWWALRAETKEWLEGQGHDLGAALAGMAWLMGNVAALYVMTDPRDMPTLAMVRSTFDGLPSLYLYDRFAGGVGLSRRAYGLDRQIMRAALDVARGCPCKSGCPACVGPELEVGEKAKRSAQILLEAIVR